MNRTLLTDVGLLVMRVGVGVMFAVAHGYGKIIGGPEKWAQLGGAMSNLGIDFAPAFWGFMAAMAEFVGGILLAAGLLTRIWAFLLMNTMIVAAVMHYQAGDPFGGATSRPIEMGFVFLGLLLTGAGGLSLDRMLLGRKAHA